MPTLYLDMDGVIADFDGYARTVLGPKEDLGTSEKWPESQWRQLALVPNLYLKLPKMRLADRMVELCRRFRDELGWDLYLLTATPKGNDVPDSFHDKILWTQQHYPDLRVRFGPYSHNKADHYKPGDVLIDDRSSNCEQWRDRGGQVIRVRADSYDQALKELADLFESIKGKHSSQNQD